MNKQYFYYLLLILALSGCSSPERVDYIDKENQPVEGMQETALTRKEEALSEVEKDFSWVAEVGDDELYFPVEKAGGYVHFYPSQQAGEPLNELGDGIAILRNLSASSGFAVNSDKLNSDIKAQLAEVAVTYHERQAARDNQLLVITGHTDASGSWAHNIDLSLRRALSTARYLEQQGVLYNSLVLIAGGPDYPIAKNNSQSNKARNRRVEILMTENEQFASHLYRHYRCSGQSCNARSMEVWAYSRDKKVSSDLRDFESFSELRSDLELLAKERTGPQVRRTFRKAPFSVFIYREFDIKKYISK
ncbi:OmpA family protein [Vibrio celticus]|uniref:OmpA family protein n=1 Tax=Vibrio celticus TaxID=446372 RepID=UPI004067EBC8